MIDKWRRCYEYLSSFNKYNSNDNDYYDNKFKKNKMKVYCFTKNLDNDCLKQ
jgi:hypothetical protein